MNKIKKKFRVVIDCGNSNNLYNLKWSLKQTLKHFCIMCKLHWYDELKSDYVKEIKEFSKMIMQLKKQYNKM